MRFGALRKNISKLVQSVEFLPVSLRGVAIVTHLDNEFIDAKAIYDVSRTEILQDMQAADWQPEVAEKALSELIDCGYFTLDGDWLIPAKKYMQRFKKRFLI